MGWIKLDRKLLDSDIWNRKPFSWGQAWVDLLLLASHEDHDIIIGSEIVHCKRGDVIRSQAWFADRWGWSRAQVRHFLTTNKVANRVAIFTTNKKTVIHIEKYAFYQGQQPTKRPINNQQSSQQKDTYKKYKEIKEVEEVDARAREDERKTESGANVNNRTDTTTSAPHLFLPPTLLDLSTYCAKENLAVDVQRFAEYYGERDWKTSTGRPVTNWRQKLRDWDAMDRPKREEDEKHRQAVERGRQEQAEREAKLEEEFKREFEKRKNAVLKAI